MVIFSSDRSTLIDIKNEVNKFNKQLCGFITHLVGTNVRLRQRFHVFIEVGAPLDDSCV